MQNPISFSIESIIARKDPPKTGARDPSEQDSTNCERYVSVLRLSGLINHSKSNCVTESSEQGTEKDRTQQNGQNGVFSIYKKSSDANRENSFVQHGIG